VTLHADAATLTTFVDALFRYVDEGTFVSFRAFRDDADKTAPVFIESVPVDDRGTPAIAEFATAFATRAAQFPFPAVFCPPIATFSNPQRAREADLANGVALSVECDTHPSTARSHLESVLGPATVVVASGGRWVDAHGREHDKLHLHWRLSEPTTDADEHARLKRARILATALVGGDATNVPAVHPIRWPGSWHRKSEPRLAKIVAADLDRELVLSDALELLEAAAPASVRDVTSRQTSGEVGETPELIRQLMTGEHMHEPLIRLAMKYLLGGMPDPQCVLTLRGLMEAIPDASRGSADRWQAHYNDVPRTVRTARERIGGTPPTPATVVDFSGLLEQPPIEAPAIVIARKPEQQDIPNELLEPPGILGDITRYGLATSVLPIPIFAVQAALAIGSVVCGRRYRTDQMNFSSLYFMNVAKSGTGKEHAKRTIENVLRAAGADRHIAGSAYSSAGAVFSALLIQPQHIAVIDEFGRYLESANGARDPHRGEALTQLMEAFGRVDGFMRTPQYSTMTLTPSAAASQQPRVISRPALTLLAMTTPSTFYASMKSSRILDGFLNRFLIVEHQAPRQESVVAQDISVPASVVAWIGQMLQSPGNIDINTLIEHVPDPAVIPMFETALAGSKAFEREMNTLANRLEREGLGDMPIRAREIAMRLSLIVSLAEVPDAPAILSEHFDWAARYVRFFLHQTIAALRGRVADTATERTRMALLNAIQAAGERGLTPRDISREKSLIGIPKRDRTEAIESLLTGELVAWTNVSTGGRARHALVALAEAETGVIADISLPSKNLERAS
jgi:hypothetical protein